jgi:hypothetical protein
MPELPDVPELPDEPAVPDPPEELDVPPAPPPELWSVARRSQPAKAMLNTAAATSNSLEVLDAVFMFVPFVKLMLSSYLTNSFTISFLPFSQTSASFRWQISCQPDLMRAQLCSSPQAVRRKT